MNLSDNTNTKILLALASGVSGYLLYDKFLSNKNKENSSKKYAKKLKEKSYEIEDLYKKINEKNIKINQNESILDEKSVKIKKLENFTENTLEDKEIIQKLLAMNQQKEREIE